MLFRKVPKVHQKYIKTTSFMNRSTLFYVFFLPAWQKQVPSAVSFNDEFCSEFSSVEKKKRAISNPSFIFFTKKSFTKTVQMPCMDSMCVLSGHEHRDKFRTISEFENSRRAL